MSILAGKTILVYRAEDSLAGGICQALVRAGARLYLVFSSAEPPPGLEDLRRAGQLAGWGCAAARPAEIIEGALQTCGKLDGLLILPARAPLKAFLEQTEADWEQEIENNILTPLFMTQAAARAWTEARLPGRVVYLTSVAGQITLQETSLAGAAHAALDWLARVAAIELGGAGIAVNVAAAGWAEGGLADGELCFTAPFQAGSTGQQAILNGVPLGRFARPDEIGRACAFLLSDDAAYITGITLPVDGGYALTKIPGNQPYPGRRTWQPYQPENPLRRKFDLSQPADESKQPGQPENAARKES